MNLTSEIPNINQIIIYYYSFYYSSLNGTLYHRFLNKNKFNLKVMNFVTRSHNVLRYLNLYCLICYGDLKFDCIKFYKDIIICNSKQVKHTILISVYGNSNAIVLKYKTGKYHY
jgi:hypothetical protein